MSDSVQIVFRGTEEYRKSLQQAALNRGIKVQQLLEESVAHYLNWLSEHAVDGINAGAMLMQSTGVGHLSKKEQVAVDAYLAFLRTAPKTEVHIVQSHIATQVELAGMASESRSQKKSSG